MRLVTQTGKQDGEGAQRGDPLLPVARLAGTRNRNAMRQLVEAVGPAMLRAVRKVMGHRTAEVEDVLQEAVEGLLVAMGAFADTYQGAAVGATVQTTSVRAGALWKIDGDGLLALRFGLGAGADRIHYRPEGQVTLVDLAQESTFYVPAASLWAAFDVRLMASLALTARVSADATLAKIHFDLHDSSGQNVRVLVPYAVRPGAALGLAFGF